MASAVPRAMAMVVEEIVDAEHSPEDFPLPPGLGDAFGRLHSLGTDKPFRFGASGATPFGVFDPERFAPVDGTEVLSR